jgi:hypothetical protein
MGSMMSSMPGMGGDGSSGGPGGGGGGGGGFPGMPQQNGTENDMPSQNIMGMQTPDFMGAQWRGAETNNAEASKANQTATAAALGGGGSTPSTIGTPNNASNPYNLPDISSLFGGGANEGLNTAQMNSNAQASNPYGLSLFQQGPQAANNYGASLTGKTNNPYQLGNSPLGSIDLGSGGM